MKARTTKYQVIWTDGTSENVLSNHKTMEAARRRAAKENRINQNNNRHGRFIVREA